MNQPISGEIALITGASRGIGRAITIKLGHLGATVIGTATTAAGVEAINHYLNDMNLPGAGRVLRVEEPESIDRLMQSVTAEFGTVAILVNNAGITHDTLLMVMKDEDWQQVIDVNLGSTFRMSRACIRGMIRQRKGRIINIASVVGFSGNAGQTNYAAAKAGMVGFTKSLAREVGSRGITVNVVAPGFIETDMTRALKEEQKNGLVAQVALRRLGSPEDVAHAVAFLALPDAAYITGETIHVNGGMYMA